MTETQSGVLAPCKQGNQNRDFSISALRLAAMMAIISCHICQALNLSAAWWLNSGVQVFLVISGYLYGRRDGIVGSAAWFVQRLHKIWIPFFITALAILIADVSFGVATVDFMDIALGLSGFRSGRIPNGTHLWYVAVALSCYLITPLLFVLRKRFGIVSLIVPLAILGVAGGEIVSSGFWSVEYVAGFTLGSLVREHPDRERSMMGVGALLGAACMLTLIILCTKGLVDFRVDGTGYIIAHLVLGIMLFCSIRWLLYDVRFSPDLRVQKLLDFGDAYSYEIYLTHQVLILGSFSLFAVPSLSVPLAMSLCLIWSIVSGILLKKFCFFIDKGLQAILDKLVGELSP